MLLIWTLWWSLQVLISSNWVNAHPSSLRSKSLMIVRFFVRRGTQFYAWRCLKINPKAWMQLNKIKLRLLIEFSKIKPPPKNETASFSIITKTLNYMEVFASRLSGMYVWNTLGKNLDPDWNCNCNVGFLNTFQLIVLLWSYFQNGLDFALNYDKRKCEEKIYFFQKLPALEQIIVIRNRLQG